MFNKNKEPQATNFYRILKHKRNEQIFIKLILSNLEIQSKLSEYHLCGNIYEYCVRHKIPILIRQKIQPKSIPNY